MKIREQRRFASRQLRDFGFGKTSMEDSLNMEVEILVKKLSKNLGNAFDLNQTFNISIVNALWMIVVGERFELDDPKLQEIVKLTNAFVRSATPNNPLSVILPYEPILNLPGIRDLSGAAAAKKMWSRINKFIGGYVKNHIEDFDPNNKKDLLDMYVEKVRKGLILKFRSNLL